MPFFVIFFVTLENTLLDFVLVVKDKFCTTIIKIEQRGFINRRRIFVPLKTHTRENNHGLIKS